MTQKIKFEFDGPTSINTKQLSLLSVIASQFDMHDIRVTNDPTNIKVYVGSYYKERYRFWLGEDGSLANILIENNLMSGPAEDSDWQQTTWYAAHDELTRLPKTKNTVLEHSPMDYLFVNREDADGVLDALINLIETYGFASVNDFYDLVGLTPTYMDEKRGWFELSSVRVVLTREGYTLNFPPARMFEKPYRKGNRMFEKTYRKVIR
jgi:hypothetical protein